MDLGTLEFWAFGVLRVEKNKRMQLAILPPAPQGRSLLASRDIYAFGCCRTHSCA